MIHILLLVLKLIGIIILSIFVIAVTLIVLVLFVPVRYQIYAEYSKDITAIVKISWLFHILSGKIYDAEDSNTIFKLFGIPIYDANRLEKMKESKEKQKKEKTNRKRNKVKAKTSEKKKETDKEIEPKTETELGIKAKAARKAETKSYQDTLTIKNDEKGKTNRAKNGDDQFSKIKIFIKKCKDLWFKIFTMCKNSKYTFERIYDKIKSVCNNIKYYLDLVQSAEAQKAYKLCKKQITYLWKNIRPRKYQVYLHVGNEDPSVTGQIMALYGILYPLYTNHVSIVPEFEQNVLEGNLSLKGSITIFVVLRVLWMVYFDKNLRVFLSMLKKEE